MATQLKYDDGYAIVIIDGGETGYPRGTVTRSRISTTHIQLANVSTNGLILRDAVSNLIDENGNPFADQDAVITWIDANFFKASGNAGGAINFSVPFFTITASADSTTLASTALAGVSVVAIAIDGQLRPATDNGVAIWRKGAPGDDTAAQVAANNITLLQPGASFANGQVVIILKGS